MGGIKMNEKLDKDRERLENQYLSEKSLYEGFGTQSIITFEEWLEIKKIYNYERKFEFSRNTEEKSYWSKGGETYNNKRG